jgi:hypothetical protein
MSRTKISEYSATAADNTDINAINIAEGCAPSGINNAIREMMKQLKDFQAGTAGDPLSVGGNLSYTGTLTGSTGILNIGSGQIYKDASGNVGVGTATPLRPLTISNSEARQIRLQHTSSPKIEFIDTTSGTSGAYIGGTANALVFETNGQTERMRITSAGDVGIGTTAPLGRLDISAAGNSTNQYTLVVGADENSTARTNNTQKNARIGLAHYTNAQNPVAIIAASSGVSINGIDIGGGTGSLNAATQVRFFTAGNTTTANGSERARIDASGNLYVGATSGSPGIGNTDTGFRILPGGNIYVSSNSASIHNLNANGTVIDFRRSGVNVGAISVTTTATSYVTSSDQRLKENITDAPSASDSIDAIQIRSFDWKADGSHQKYGVIAQELEPIAPEAVSKGETEEDMWGVDYSKLVPMLIKEVQSLRARVAQLEGE